jgi:hypothetical protein
MTRKWMILAGSVLILTGAGAAAWGLGWCPLGGCCASSCAAPDAGGPVATAAFTGDYDRKMSLVCQLACAAKAPPEGAEVAAQPDVVPGKLTRCPVSGVVFTVTAESARIARGGHEWTTCCATCADMVRKEPTRYLSM